MSNISPPPSSPETPSAKSPRLAYLPALDGLRALAVLAVLFYHADVLWLPGGFLGVEIFFVVSGYLITSLLLSEYRANHSINLIQFWQRRARRLLPALFAMLIAVLSYAVIFLPDEVASLRADVVAAFAYVTNWYLIVAEKSYFEIVGRPSLLRHLWSLAVEEQFYLVWPLLFVLLLARLKTRGAMLLLMFGATLSALWMGAQFQPDTDPSRIYYGTDTRAAGLLIGAALAFVWLPRANDANKSRARRWLLDLVGILALGALIAACLMLSEFDPFLYQGGMLLVAAATALVIAAVVSPQSPFFASLLGFGVLRWIGLRSYSLYLWHWPVFMVTRPQLDTTLEGAPLLALRFVLTFALAEISYRVIETPIRHGALGEAWHAWQRAHGARRWGVGFAWMGIVASIAFGAFLLGSAVMNAQRAPEPDFVFMTAEEESVSFDESLASAQSEDESSSDLSSISFVIPEEILNESALLTADPSTTLDNWVQMVNTTRVPLIRSPSFEMSAGISTNPKNTARVSPIQSLCTEACQTRLEYAQLKAGTLRAAKNPPQLFALKIPLQPIAPRATLPTPLVPQPPRVSTQALALGDSVMLGASAYLRKNFVAIDVDAKLGRQVSAALKILRERQGANRIPPVVIVHLGNNGTFSAKQFDEMMNLLRDVPRVIFLTNKVPRKWQEPNNKALVEGVKRHPNATLIDWNSASALHPEWFWKDGIHLRPEGAKVYANLIADVIKQATP